jgi:hypothetical protein
MGWISDVGDFVADVAAPVVDVVEPFVEPFVETFIDPAIAAAEAAAAEAAAFAQAAAAEAAAVAQVLAAEAASAAASAVDASLDLATIVLDSPIGDAADWGLSALDTTVFDPVDFVTSGAINVDYADGRLAGGADLGVASAGINIGENGVGANVDIGIASAGVSIKDGDLSAAGSYGVDWGPLPYVEGHVNIGDDGSIEVGGRAQATLPTPWGIHDGAVNGGYHQQPDGSWGAYGGVDHTLITPSGVTVSSGGQVSYDIEADGDERFQAGGYVGVGIVGGPSVEVGGEYHYTEDDGTVTEGGSAYVEAEGYGLGGRVEAGYDRVEDAEGNVTETYSGGVEASGYGVEVGASGEYERAETADGTITETYSGQVEASGYGLEAQAGGSTTESTTAAGVTTSSSDAWVDVEGLDTDALMSAAGQFAGAAAGTTTVVVGGPVATVAETVTNLAGSGDLSEAISTMADTAGQSVAEIAGNLAESGNFDDFSSDVITSEVTEAVADDMWDDLT